MIFFLCALRRAADEPEALLIEPPSWMLQRLTIQGDPTKQTLVLTVAWPDGSVDQIEVAGTRTPLSRGTYVYDAIIRDVMTAIEYQRAPIDLSEIVARHQSSLHPPAAAPEDETP